MPDRQQLHEYYEGLSGDDLARLALTAELTLEAREVITEELQRRGLTDLSDFKRRMKEDAVLTNPARYNEVSWEMERRWKQALAVAGLVVCAWMAAAFFPIVLLTADRSQSLDSKVKVAAISGFFIALSVYLGLRARREGRRLAFYLRAVVTLVLLCTSIVIALVSR